MSKVFVVSSVKHEFCNIKSYMNEIFLNLQKGNVNKIVIIDEYIHKSLKIIKKNFSCLTYKVSQITTLTFAIEILKHIVEVFRSYFGFIDEHLIDTQNIIELKNRDIFDYCDSASQQINNYINNFHYERMKAICLY